MKRLFIIIALLSSIGVTAQIPNNQPTYFVNGLRVPILTTPVVNSQGWLNYFTSSNKLAVHDGTAYRFLLTETLASASYVPLSRTINGQPLSSDITIATGSGTVTSFGKTDLYGITSSVANPTTAPVHSIGVDTSVIMPKANSLTLAQAQTKFNTKFNNPTGNTTQYLAGDGSLLTFATSVRVSPLTGLSVTNSAIVGTDLVLAGFGKAQGQINAINSNLALKANLTDLTLQKATDGGETTNHVIRVTGQTNTGGTLANSIATFFGGNGSSSGFNYSATGSTDGALFWLGNNNLTLTAGANTITSRTETGSISGYDFNKRVSVPNALNSGEAVNLSQLNSAVGSYVTLGTTQTITATKEFSAGLTATGVGGGNSIYGVTATGIALRANSSGSGTGVFSESTSGLAGQFQTASNSFPGILVRNNGTAKIASFYNSSGEIASVTNNGVFQGTGLTMAIRTVNANYTLDDSDYTVIVQGSASTITITLPSSTNGRMYIIKRTNGGVGSVVITASSIDGVTTKTLTTDNTGVVLQSAGSGQYYIVGTI